MHPIERACWAIALSASLAAPAATQDAVRIEPQLVVQPESIRFLPGSVDRVLVRDAGGALRIVDFADPARPVVRFTFAERPRGVAIMPDGRIAAGGDGVVRFLTQGGAEAAPPLAVPGRTIGSLALSRSGRMLAAGDTQGRILIWRRDAAAWTPIATIEAMPARGDCDWSVGIDGFVFSPDETLLAVSTCPGGLSVWTIADSRRVPVEAPEAIGGGLNTDLAFSADGRFLVAHYRFQPGSLRLLWPVEGSRLGAPRVLDTNHTGAMVSDPTGSDFVIAEADGIAFRAPDGRELRPRISAASITSLAVSDDGSRLAAVEDRRIRLWDGSGRPLPAEPFGEASAFGAVLALGDRIAAAYRDGSLRFWRWSGEPVGPAIPVTRARRANEQPIDFTLALLPDGQTIAATDADGVVRFFDLDGTPKGTVLQLLYPRESDYSRLETQPAFGPDGLVATTSFRTSLLRLSYDGRWHGDSFARHRREILAIAQRGGDGLIATADSRALRFWSAAGRPVGEPIELGDIHIARSLRFSADGRMLVVGAGFAIWRADAPARLQRRDGTFIGYVDGGFVWQDERRVVLEAMDGRVLKSMPRAGDALAAAPDGSGVLVLGNAGARFRRFDAGAEAPPSLWGQPTMKYSTLLADGRLEVEFEHRTIWWSPRGDMTTSDRVDQALHSPDGKWRIAHARPGYRARRADGTGETVELPGDYIFFAPRGGFVATATSPRRDGVYTLRLYDGDFKPVMETTFEGEHYGRIAVAPDGAQMAVWAGTRIRFVDGAGRWSARSIEAGDPLGALSLDYAPNGRWLAAIDPAKRLRLIGPDGTLLTSDAIADTELERVVIAPDSASLAAYDSGGRLSLWPVDAATGRLGARRAVRSEVLDYAPRFDFRGGRLWLVREPNELVLLDAALSELARVYLAADGWLAVLADGRHCGAGPIFDARHAYRGADLLAPAARDALVDCAAVRAAFEP